MSTASHKEYWQWINWIAEAQHEGTIDAAKVSQLSGSVADMCGKSAQQALADVKQIRELFSDENSWDAYDAMDAAYDQRVDDELAEGGK